MTPFPDELHTERLVLRRWGADDAVQLLPLLIANADHLRGWIPDRVAAPAPLPELAQRLETYASNFDANIEWRFAVLMGDRLIGEASLFARNESGRVPLVDADRFEIGYWIDQPMTGQGFAQEATTALLDVARALPVAKRVEIRCSPQNHASAAIPRKLGFKLEDPPKRDIMVWYCDINLR